MKSKISRDTTRAVNIEDRMPTDKVTAKPWIGPLPICDRTTAAMKVVMLASSTARNALAKPARTAAAGDLPARNSSLMRSKMITLASTAMPTVRITPAMLGRVSVKPSTDRIDTTKNRLSASTRSAINPAPW